MSMKMVKSLAYKIRLAYEEMAGATRATKGALGGYCYRAAPQLVIAANKIGIEVGIVGAEGHVFNYYDGHVIDITASQFAPFNGTRLLIQRCPFLDISKVLGNTHKPKPDIVYKSIKEFSEKSSWRSVLLSIKEDGKVVSKYI